MYAKLQKIGLPEWLVLFIVNVYIFLRNQILYIYRPYGGGDWYVTVLGLTVHITQESPAIGNKRGLYFWYFNWYLGFISRK